MALRMSAENRRPKNGQYWRAVLVGGIGTNIETLIKNIEDYGIEIHRHMTTPKDFGKTISMEGIDLMIVVANSLSSNPNNLVLAAKRQNIHLIWTKHKWVTLQAHLEQSGIYKIERRPKVVPIRPPSRDEEELNAINRMLAEQQRRLNELDSKEEPPEVQEALDKEDEPARIVVPPAPIPSVGKCPHAERVEDCPICHPGDVDKEVLDAGEKPDKFLNEREERAFQSLLQKERKENLTKRAIKAAETRKAREEAQVKPMVDVVLDFLSNRRGSIAIQTIIKEIDPKEDSKIRGAVRRLVEVGLIKSEGRGVYRISDEKQEPVKVEEPVPSHPAPPPSKDAAERVGVDAAVKILARAMKTEGLTEVKIRIQGGRVVVERELSLDEG